ncbi:MAG: tetratricopeptide repeat protein [Chitinophagaceae bacterium]
MKKITFSLIAVAVSAGALLAQSVDQGKKFLYYQRYKSAQDQFEKVLAGNPNDIAAVYWLGQTFLENKSQPGGQDLAKNLYQKALATNGSAPLILVGVGQIELLEGKNNDARQRFETAISLSKAKDIDVLNAIGQANADADTKTGDPNYAIEKLNLATQIKNFKNPYTYSVMGDAYRKLVDGGAAVTSFQKALGLDPKYAEAKYKIGKVYMTQNNKEQFLPAFEEAIQLDPNYAPAYYELYYYWYFHGDVNKSITYFDKYLTVTDPKPSDEYDKIGNVYAAKNYADAIAKAQAKITAEGANADPRYYRLLAYSYSDMGDSTNAKKSLDDFFAKQKPEGFVPMDYSFRAELMAKFPETQGDALASYQKAVDADTALESKLELLSKAGALAKKIGRRDAEAGFLSQLYTLKKTPSNTDLYNLGQAYYQAKNYVTADSIYCGVYQTKYPDEIFGYLWCARSKGAQDDSTNSGGLAVDAYKILADKGRLLDSVKYKSQVLGAYYYLIQYYNDIKKDKETAIMYVNKGLETDPANADLTRILGILTKPPAKQAAPAKQPAAKPKTATKTGAK